MRYSSFRKFRLPLLAAAAFAAIHLNGCAALADADSNGDGILDSTELDGLTNQLLNDALAEFGLGELGGIFADSAEYEQIPDTTVEPIEPDPVDTADTAVVALPSVDLSLWLPDPLSQGGQGSCSGWAGAAILSFLHNYENDINDEASQALARFSPSYIYNNIKLDDTDCDAGSYGYLAAEFLVANGDVPMSRYAYDEARCPVPSSSLESAAMTNARPEYRRVPMRIGQVKTWLDQAKPLLVAIMVDENFVNISGSEIYNSYSGSGGGHAIVVIGYDDDRQAVRLYNSWGADWADNGMAWVDYDTFLEIVREIYVVL